ncbi:protein kinase [Streptomyces sp. TS71-3]|uniref:AbiJ-related protein n=1 Tax=Streptomyces sp. TS71-3 TaxID=2733862 RepID=UPI001B1B2557|nr:protein kinase [Streptomyces sp. TS71-3]GHJ36041.1 hypothetical protein Sm713_16500 [Streptomyces sp. TS71-3]
MDSGHEQVGERVLAQAAAVFSARSDTGAIELLRAVERLDFEQTDDGFTDSTNWHSYFWAALFYIDEIDMPSFGEDVLEYLLPTIAEVASQNGRSSVDRILLKPALPGPDDNWRHALHPRHAPSSSLLQGGGDEQFGRSRPPRISEVTRRRLFDALRLQKVDWAGELDEVEFLKRIFDLDTLESYDSRFATAEGDIIQHRFNNEDWESDWVFTDPRFGLSQGPDSTFLRFLSEMLHPIVRTDVVEVQRLLKVFNSSLARDGYTISSVDTISGFPIFGGRRIPVQARPAIPGLARLATATANSGRSQGEQGAMHPYDQVRAQARGNRKDYALNRLPEETGGQAEVFRAVHKATGAEVAFKRRSSEWEEPRARMRREIEVSQLLGRHPNYMPILDSNPEDGWLVMPMAQGTAEDCRDLLNDPTHLRALVEALMDVLELAHTHDWLHRDVKPSNILLLDKRWTLADWGIVRRPRGQTTKVGRTRKIGTEGFGAPELFLDAHDATPSSDIYGIGRVIAWALTGENPQMNVQLLPDPGPWRNVTRVAAHADPKQRPQTIQELRQLINREFTEPSESPVERARRLRERARAGDPQAVNALLELIVDYPESYTLYLHVLTELSAEQAGPWLSRNSQDSNRLLQAMARHADGGGRRRVQFSEAARAVIWLLAIANFATAKEDWDLLDDAARRMFIWDTAWDQWNAQDQIAPWLRSLSGKAANLVAAVLHDHPGSARHFSGLSQDGTVDPWVRQAIRAAVQTGQS